MKQLLSFAGRHGPALLFVGVFIGLLLPELADAARLGMGGAVFVFTLGAMLKVEARDLSEQAARPAIWRGRWAALPPWRRCWA